MGFFRSSWNPRRLPGMSGSPRIKLLTGSMYCSPKNSSPSQPVAQRAGLHRKDRPLGVPLPSCRASGEVSQSFPRSCTLAGGLANAKHLAPGLGGLLGVGNRCVGFALKGNQKEEHNFRGSTMLTNAETCCRNMIEHSPFGFT